MQRCPLFSVSCTCTEELTAHFPLCLVPSSVSSVYAGSMEIVLVFLNTVSQRNISATFAPIHQVADGCRELCHTVNHISRHKARH